MLQPASFLTPHRVSDDRDSRNRIACSSQAGRRCLMLLLCGVALFAGCTRQEPIRRYQVAKQVRGEPSHRMLAATVFRGDKAWFFKAVGPAAEIAAQTESIRGWIASLRFPEGGDPEWELPEGWQQSPASQMRFATLRWQDSSEASDVSVIPLPITDEESQYLLSNVNRWRQQLQLPAISLEQLSEQSEQIPLEDGSATLVDLSGWSTDTGMARGPGGPNARGAPAGRTMPTREEVQLEYEVPEGWTQGQMVVSRGGITLRYEAAFDIGEGSELVQVTVTRMPGVGSLKQNIDRWRSQVGLDPLSDEQLAETTEQIEVGDLAANYVRALGSEQAILGAVAAGAPGAWFFKMTGPRQPVEINEADFRAYLDSVRVVPSQD